MFVCTLLCVASITAACEDTSTVSVTAPTSSGTSNNGEMPDFERDVVLFEGAETGRDHR